MSVNITTVFQPTVTITVSDDEYQSLLNQNLVYSVQGGPPIVRPTLPDDVILEIGRQTSVAVQNFGLSYAQLSGNGLERLQQQRAAALRSWWFALANRDLAPATVRFGPGDSITEGQGATTRDRRWVQKTQALLRQRFPNALTGTIGGTGWIDPYQVSDSFGQPATVTGNPGKDTGFGLSRRSYVLDSTARSWQVTVRGTSIDIHGVQVNGATATLTIDGVSQTVSFGGSGVADGKVIRVSLGASGNHTVKLTGATGAFYFTGIYVYDGDESAGIRTYANGTYGQSTAYFLFDAPEPLKAIQPDLFVIALSINDYAASGSAATAKANLQQIIAACKASSTKNPSIVLMPYFLRAGTFTGDSWQTFVDAHYAIAASDPSVCVLDLSVRMPSGASDAGVNRFYTDGVHPTDMSHAYIADQLARFLSPM